MELTSFSTGVFYYPQKEKNEAKTKRDVYKEKAAKDLDELGIEPRTFRML